MGLGAGVQGAVKGAMLTERLPDIEDMPVLNFTGELKALEVVVEQGRVRMVGGVGKSLGECQIVSIGHLS